MSQYHIIIGELKYQWNNHDRKLKMFDKFGVMLEEHPCKRLSEAMIFVNVKHPDHKKNWLME